MLLSNPLYFSIQPGRGAVGIHVLLSLFLKGGMLLHTKLNNC